MARVLKPIAVPSGVNVTVSGQVISVKGAKGTAEHVVHPKVSIHQEDNELRFDGKSSDKGVIALIGTTRALVSNMMTGVGTGFVKKLALVGVGYRAQAQGQVLNLALGFSHPVNYEVPEGITVETPSQTEILVKGVDRQKVGQVAADIRAFRPPEPYKGKGIRYSDERIVLKEAKKK